MGPEIVILTGVSHGDSKIGAVAYNRTTGEMTSYFADKMERSYHGTGDIFSAVVISNLVKGESMETALKDACLFVVKAIQKTLPDETHGYGVKFEEVLEER